MKTGWLKDGGKWYHFSAAGVMQNGGLRKVTLVPLKMVQAKCKLVGLQDGGTWYYLNGSGAMATGWAQVGGTWYYLKQFRCYENWLVETRW